jgi:type IV pilus assembly protein PilC
VVAVEAQLRTLGLWLLKATPASFVSNRGRAGSRLRRVPRRELVGFFVEMSLLLRAGITLPHALRRLSDDLKDDKLGPAVTVLRDQVATGTPLHTAMEDMPKIFPQQVAALAEAGEAGGKLAETFENLAAYYQWLDQLMADVRQAMVYPLFVLAATVALVLSLFTFIVPRFAELLGGLSIQMPLLTRIVMGISFEMVGHWILCVAVPIALIAALKTVAKFEASRRWRDAAILRAPIFGHLAGMFAFSRFAQNLGMLYRSGIPLLRGLEICRGLVGNAVVTAALDDVRQRVAEGSPLSVALAKHAIFPPGLVTMISAGEASGKLDFALQSVSTYYNQIIPRRIKLVFSVFDPAIMLTLIGMVGVVALAVVMPLLQLWQAR